MKKLGWSSALVLAMWTAPAHAGGADPAAAGPVRDSLGQVMGPGTAAIVRLNEQVDRALNLVARIEVQTDEVFELYEPSPGLLLVSGAGRPADGFRITDEALRERSPEEVWSLVAGGRPVPPRVREAFTRHHQRRRAGSGRPTGTVSVGDLGAGSPDDAPKSEPPTPLDPGWCDTTYYSTFQGGCFGNFQICFDNIWSWAWAWHNNVESVWTSACAAGGGLDYEVVTDGYRGYWTVPFDTMRWVSVMDIGCGWLFNDCPYVRADVRNASRFHFRFNAAVK